MDLFEYQGKQYFARYDIPVSKGDVAVTVDQAVTAADAAGYPVILHVHDEMVCEVPEAEAESALAKIMEIMSIPPMWIPDIPVAAEGHICDLYSK